MASVSSTIQCPSCSIFISPSSWDTHWTICEAGLRGADAPSSSTPTTPGAAASTSSGGTSSPTRSPVSFGRRIASAFQPAPVAAAPRPPPNIQLPVPVPPPMQHVSCPYCFEMVSPRGITVHISTCPSRLSVTKSAAQREYETKMVTFILPLPHHVILLLSPLCKKGILPSVLTSLV
jgi:hypothetical protein